MRTHVSLDLPVSLAHPASPPAYDFELYPSQVRSLMVAWQASRLEHYVDKVRAVRETDRRATARR